MKKLNRNYTSFLEFIGLVSHEEYPGYHNGRYYDGSDESPTLGISKEIGEDAFYFQFQLLGALRPFAKIGKDFLDTFRPYYSTNKIKNDILQPIRGLRNLGLGVISLVGGTASLGLYLTLLALSIVFIPVLIPFIPAILRSIAPKIAYSFSWMIEGIGNIARGLTQIASTPLVYCLKIPFRRALTYFQKEKKYAENKPEIIRLVNETYSKIFKMNNFVKVPKAPDCKKYSDFEKAYEKYSQCLERNVGCHKLRREIAGSLREIQRKYKKSVDDHGWRTCHDSKDIESAFQQLSIFRTAAEKNNNGDETPIFISKDDQEKAASYLRKFNPQLGRR